MPEYYSINVLDSVDNLDERLLSRMSSTVSRREDLSRLDQEVHRGAQARIDDVSFWGEVVLNVLRHRYSHHTAKSRDRLFEAHT